MKKIILTIGIALTTLLMSCKTNHQFIKGSTGNPQWMVVTTNK